MTTLGTGFPSHDFNDDEFNRRFRKAAKVAKWGGVGFLLVWLFGIALSLTLTGVIIWAIIRLVQHFT